MDPYPKPCIKGLTYIVSFQESGIKSLKGKTPSISVRRSMEAIGLPSVGAFMRILMNYSQGIVPFLISNGGEREWALPFKALVLLGINSTRN